MQVTTTRHNGPKPFAWSYSKLKNFETCPKRHWHVDLKKDFVEADSEQLKEGNRVHAMFEKRIQTGAVFPPPYDQMYEPWIVRAFDVKNANGEWRGLNVLEKGAKAAVEQKLAINKNFEPTGYFANDVWFRGKADLLWTLGPLGCVIDWKTGKIVEDSVQLMLTAACMFAHYPEVQTIRSMFVWLKDDAETTLDIRRDEMPTVWSNLWQRIEALEAAHKEVSYPPTPSYICQKWCPVTVCPFHGKGV